MRRALIGAVLAAICVAPSAVTATRSGWQWIPVERMKYVSTGSGALMATFVTSPISTFPGITATISRSDDQREARVRLQAIGPPAAIGRVIALTVTEVCEETARGNTANRSYTYNVRPGQIVELPASPVTMTPPGVAPDQVLCVWKIGVRWPTAGSGTHRLTVDLSVYGPIDRVISTDGSLYEREQCSITVGTNGSSRSCSRLT